MRLSEAIMLNGMTKPQGFLGESITSVEAPCAIGGALQAIGRQNTVDYIQNYNTAKEVWPWAWDSDIEPDCPACGRPDLVIPQIWHLNDNHRWTRQQIAEWVATIEPQEPELIEIPEACEVANELP